MTGKPLGVGFIGAGPVVQAIHLPTLARMPHLFQATHVMDIDGVLAESVALSAGAQSSSSLDDVLADDSVDVVVIGSPPRFHAEQTLAAIQAGKRAVLCEKPFAATREDAETIAAASRQHNVPVIVGAMHTYDPTWRGNADMLMPPGDVSMIRSRIVLPPNPVYEDQAADIIRPDRAAPPAAPSRADAIRGAVLGLAIHNTPLIREFLPDWANTTVTSATLLKPWGYAIDLVSGSTLIQLIGLMGAPTRADWTLDITSENLDVHAQFPPSYVHAGSAVVTQVSSGERKVTGPVPMNGYEAEWRHLERLISSPGQAAAELESMIEDLDFALRIADQAAALVAGVPA